MKVQDIINQQVNVFKCGTNSSRPYYTSTLIDFLYTTTERSRAKIDYLRKLNKQDEKAAKKYKSENLLACTVCGTFKGRRVVGCIDKKTGIIAIDIDLSRNPQLDVKKAKRDVMRLPSVFLSQLSCRGEGIYCLVYYNSEHYIGYVFNALRDDFKKIGYNIDPDCSDITRLRYVSYDDNILVKQGDIPCYENWKDDVAERYEIEDEWQMTKQDVKDIVVCVFIMCDYLNYTSDEYYDWLLDGFRLATLPNKEVGLMLFKKISECSDNFVSYEDVENKFNECLRTTTYKTNILGYYINRVKEVYGPEWRFRVNELLRNRKIC